MKPLKAGFTLSATVVLFYAVCTVLWLTFPEPFLNFMNALFHGLDFRKLETGNSISAWTSRHHLCALVLCGGRVLCLAL